MVEIVSVYPRITDDFDDDDEDSDDEKLDGHKLDDEKLDTFNKLYAELKRYQSMEELTLLELEEFRKNVMKYISSYSFEYDAYTKQLSGRALFSEAIIDTVGKVRDAVKIIMTSPFKSIFNIHYLTYMFCSKHNLSDSEEMLKFILDSLDIKDLKKINTEYIFLQFLGDKAGEDLICPGEFIFEENRRYDDFYIPRLDIPTDIFDNLRDDDNNNCLYTYHIASFIVSYLRSKNINPITFPLPKQGIETQEISYFQNKFFIEHYRFKNNEEIWDFAITLISMSFSPYTLSPLMEKFIEDDWLHTCYLSNLSPPEITEEYRSLPQYLLIAEELIKKYGLINFEFNWHKLYRTFKQYERKINIYNSFERSLYEKIHNIDRRSPHYDPIYHSDKTEDDIQNESDKNIQDVIRFLRARGRNPALDSYRGIANLLYDVTPKDIPVEVLDIIGSYTTFDMEG